MIIVRYADDFIVGFQYERDARSDPASRTCFAGPHSSRQPRSER